MLIPEEIDLVNSYLTARWNLHDSNPNCSLSLNCTLPVAVAVAASSMRCLAGALMTANASLVTSIPFERAALIIEYTAAFQARCILQKNGTLPLLPTKASTMAALNAYITTIQQLVQGLTTLLASYEGSTDWYRKAAWDAWQRCV